MSETPEVSVRRRRRRVAPTPVFNVDTDPTWARQHLSTWRSWVGPVLVALLAALLRLPGLDRIKSLIFDETYYVKDAWAVVKNGVEMQWPKNFDPLFIAGNTSGWSSEGAFIAHPPVGKWVIGIGELALGVDNPWGWRISVAIAGVLMTLILARAAQRLLHSTFWGTLAGLFLAIDGTAIVHSRTALLDNILSFFVLTAFALLLLDRDRDRLRKLQGSYRFRWARMFAGVSLGLACGTKWSGIFFLAVFGILTVLWDMKTRQLMAQFQGAEADRSDPKKFAWLPAWFAKDAVPAFFALVGTSAVVYFASWSGWFASAKGWGRHWAAENGYGDANVVTRAVVSWWHYQSEMWKFNTTLTSTHPYQSNPWGWLIQWRPTSFFFERYDYGDHGCLMQQCDSAVNSVGNPLLWWLGTIALAVTLVLLLVKRDLRAGAILSGIIAGWVPWLIFADRTIFTFYVIAFEPWMMLALVYVAMQMWGRDGSRERHFYVGAFLGSLLALLLLISWFFYPLWTGIFMTPAQWQWHMWLPSWV